MPTTDGQSGRMAAVEPPERTSQRAAFIYAAMVAGAVGLFVIIKTAGKLLSAPAQSGPVRFGRIAQAAASGELAHVLLALVIIIVFARGLGAAFKKIHQPEVVGEVIAGIALGPSLLGRLAPAASSFILPVTVAPYLNIIASVGVILYMFLVGVELDTQLLRRRTHASVDRKSTRLNSSHYSRSRMPSSA